MANRIKTKGRGKKADAVVPRETPVVEDEEAAVSQPEVVVEEPVSTTGEVIGTIINMVKAVMSGKEFDDVVDGAVDKYSISYSKLRSAIASLECAKKDI